MKSYALAMGAATAPAARPAKLKQAIVPIVGRLPGRFTVTSGSSSLMILPIVAEALYLANWYIEKEAVRTMVMLERGAKKPRSRQYVSFIHRVA